MECFLCSKEKGAEGELPIKVHSGGKMAHEQCFVKWRAFELMNGNSEDMGGYTYEWTTKIQKYLPTEVAEAIKAMQG